MNIVYFSKTGNIKKFLSKTNLNPQNFYAIFDYNKNEDFILITSTLGFGQIPKDVEFFLKSNHNYLKGVIGSGNRNWGKNFCQAAKEISKIYNVPLLQTFELSGNEKDILKFKKLMEENC